MVRIKNLRPNNFAFRKILKIQKMFLLLFYNVQEKILTDRATIKSCKRRWTRSTLKAEFYIKRFIFNLFIFQMRKIYAKRKNPGRYSLIFPFEVLLHGAGMPQLLVIFFQKNDKFLLINLFVLYNV